MSRYLHSMLEALRSGDDAKASAAFRIHVQESVASFVNEDHELYMSSNQMEKHINKLHDYASDKPAFLSKLASFSDVAECTEKDFRKCTDSIQAKGKDYMDKAIHSLEKLIGYDFDPKELKENFGNVITRATKGAPDNNAVIPNAYVTKNIPKSKKKLPRLKKGVYGTGIAPGGWHGDSGGEGAAGGEGGGGGE